MDNAVSFLVEKFMTSEDARWNMIYRLLRLDDGEDEDDEDSPETPVQGGGRSNTRLPYGLCNKYGIALPKKATPHEAWEALEGKTGITAEETYGQVKKTGTITGVKPKDKKIKPAPGRFKGIKAVGNLKEFPVEMNPFAEDSGLPILNLHGNIQEKEDFTKCGLANGDSFGMACLKKGAQCRKELIEKGVIKNPNNLTDEGIDTLRAYQREKIQPWKVEFLNKLEKGTILRGNFSKDIRGNYQWMLIKNMDGKWELVEDAEELNKHPGHVDSERFVPLTSKELVDLCMPDPKNAATIYEPKEGAKLICYNANPKSEIDSKGRIIWEGGQTSCMKHVTKAKTVMETVKFLSKKLGRKVSLKNCKGIAKDGYVPENAEWARQISDAVLSVKEFYNLSGPAQIFSGDEEKLKNVGDASAYYNDGHRSLGFREIHTVVSDRLFKKIQKDSLESWHSFYNEQKEKLEKGEGDSLFVSWCENELQKLTKEVKFKRGNFSIPGREAECVALHEMGHEVYYELYKWGAGGTDIVSEAYMKAQKNKDIRKISVYANTSMQEFFSECFAMYHTGQKLPKYIKRMIEYGEYLRDRKGKG